MLYLWRSGVSVGLSLLLLMGCLLIACGPGDECAVNGDCIDKKGPDYVCTAQGGKRTCTKKAATCPTSCSNATECAPCTDGKTSCTNGVCSAPQTQCPGSCSADADCLNCTDGKTSCVGGACGTKAPTCPNACATDGDCKDCAGGNNTCVTGTCGQKPGQCPMNCDADGDCSSCPDGRTSCVSRSCGKKPDPPQCPSTCSADADCAPCPDSKTTCVGGACAKKPDPPQCPAACTTNADCAPCAADKQTCTGGACGTVQPPQCPAACAAAADCANCPDGKTACENNVCAKPVTPPQCPAACNGNADCANCPDGRLVCSGGTCNKPTNPQCPGTCANDTDCASCPANQQQCVNNACGTTATCPSTCAADIDCAPCPGTNIVCDQTSKTCKAGNTNQCPPTCQNDAQCNVCGTGFTCQQNVCTKASTNPNVGADCTQTQTCSAGFICLSVTQTQALCFQDCSQAATACANNTDGRTTCRQVATDQTTGAAISICLAVVTKGQKCGFVGALHAQCQAGLSPALYCSVTNGTCDEVIVQKTAGAACNNSTDTTEPFKICDNASLLACDEATGKCVTATAAQEGEACDTTGAALGKAVLCDPTKKDLTCISFNSNGQNSRCHYLCNPTGAGQCAHTTGLTCAALLANGGGLCLDLTCTTDADCAYTGYTCENANGGGKICFPPQPIGPKKFGEICGNPVTTKGCASGLFCLTVSGASSGWCSQVCTSGTTTCPSIGTIASSCTVINTNGDEACLFPCSTMSTTPACPTGLTCQSVGIDTCLAP